MKLMYFVILSVLSAGLTGIAQTAGRAPESAPAAPGPVALVRPPPGGPRTFNPAGLVGMVNLAGRNSIVMLDGQIGLDRLRIMQAGIGVIEIPLVNHVAGSFASEQPFLLPGGDWGCKSASIAQGKTQSTLTFGAFLKTQRSRCSFGDKTVDLILLDANESGTFGEPSAVETDADGFASRLKQGDVAFIGGEPYPLGLPFVALGAVWKLSSAEGRMTATRQTEGAGAVAWRGSLPQEVRLTLAGKDLLLTARKPLMDGTWLLPAGDYRIKQWHYGLNGMQVDVDGNGKPEAMQLKVTAGKSQTIGPLPEIVAKATPMVNEGTVRFDLNLSAPNGAGVKLIGGQKPQLRVLNGAGMEVYRGSFEYG